MSYRLGCTRLVGCSWSSVRECLVVGEWATSNQTCVSFVPLILIRVIPPPALILISILQHKVSQKFKQDEGLLLSVIRISYFCLVKSSAGLRSHIPFHVLLIFLIPGRCAPSRRADVQLWARLVTQRASHCVTPRFGGARRLCETSTYTAFRGTDARNSYWTAPQRQCSMW